MIVPETNVSGILPHRRHKMQPITVNINLSIPVDIVSQYLFKDAPEA